MEEEEAAAVAAATISLAMRGRMNFVTRLTPPRTELTRTSTGDKAQEKRTGLAEGAGRDQEGRGGRGRGGNVTFAREDSARWTRVEMERLAL